MGRRPSKNWPSAASEELKKYLKSERSRAVRLAEALGVGQDTVSRWAHGKRKPDAEQMVRLEEATGIACRAWGMHPEGSGQSPSSKSGAAA